MDHHGVFDGFIGEDIARGDAAVIQLAHRPRRLAGNFQPHRLSGRRQRGVRQRQTQRFRHHLRGARRAEELTPAARRGAGATAQLGGLLQGEFVVGKARADGLHFARVFPHGWRQRRPARHQNGRQVVHRGQGNHGGGQPFIAGRDADHRPARREGTDQAAKHDRRVVTVRQGVEHAVRALRAPVARIADEGRKRDPAVAGDLFRRRLHLHADLPVAGVVAQRNRASVPGADAALGADDQHLFAGQLVGVPAHPGVLRHAEQVAAGGFHQHLRGQRQRALRPRRVGDDGIKRLVLRGENLLDGHGYRPAQQSLSCCSRVFSCALRGSSSAEAGGSTCVEIGRPQSTIASLMTFTNGVSS